MRQVSVLCLQWQTLRLFKAGLSRTRAEAIRFCFGRSQLVGFCSLFRRANAR